MKVKVKRFFQTNLHFRQTLMKIKKLFDSNLIGVAIKS